MEKMLFYTANDGVKMIGFNLLANLDFQFIWWPFCMTAFLGAQKNVDQILMLPLNFYLKMSTPPPFNSSTP